MTRVSCSHRRTPGISAAQLNRCFSSSCEPNETPEQSSRTICNLTFEFAGAARLHRLASGGMMGWAAFLLRQLKLAPKTEPAKTVVSATTQAQKYFAPCSSSNASRIGISCHSDIVPAIKKRQAAKPRNTNHQRNHERKNATDATLTACTKMCAIVGILSETSA